MARSIIIINVFWCANPIREMSIFQLKKLRFNEVTRVIKGHTADTRHWTLST